MRAIVLAKNSHRDLAIVVVLMAVLVGEFECGDVRSGILEKDHSRSQCCDI
jgi:hypothetical protein